MLGQWWTSLDTANKIGVLGLIATILGILPGYLALRSNRKSQSSSPSPVAGATSEVRKHFRSRGSLRIDVAYAWTVEGIMWALPTPLAPEDEPVVMTPKLVGNLSAQERLEELLARRNGVKIGGDSRGEQRPFSELRLMITGQHSNPVLITGLKANVLKRERPLSGTIVYGPPEGVGETIQLGFDLDALSPIAQSFDNEMYLAGPYFARHHVSVKNGEQAVFSIRAFTNECYCEWEILVEANVDDKKKVFSVRDGSRPFRTTSLADSYRSVYRFDFFKGQFVKLPPDSRLFE